MEAYLKKLLNEEIPISKAIGIEVTMCTATKIQLTAPLMANINHKLTAFGGSLYSVAVLSCWSLLHIQLVERNIQAHIVIQDGSINYGAPVIGDILAECSIASAAPIEKMLKTLDRKGRARIKLFSTIAQANQQAVRFDGRFVIHH